MTEQNNKLLDKHIGEKIRQRRKALDLTQGDLAQIIGVSHQQIQRYESGENPLSMSRMLEISNILNIKPEYFYEDLDLEKTSRQKNQEGIIRKDSSRPLRILLVEDNIADEMLFRKALTKSEVKTEIETIQSPEKVIDFLKNNIGSASSAANQPRGSTSHVMFRPDILILDINMPRISGIELLKTIKSDQKLRMIPVIMLTNSIRSKDMLDAYTHQASGFIQKNCNLAEFFNDIDRVMQYWKQTIILPSDG